MSLKRKVCVLFYSFMFVAVGIARTAVPLEAFMTTTGVTLVVSAPIGNDGAKW